LLADGVVPGTPTVVARTQSGKTRTIFNPFTGEPVVLEIKNHTKIQTLVEIAQALETLEDYEVNVSGNGRPAISLFPIDFTGTYHVGVTCFVSSSLRSTSNLHPESGKNQEAAAYREPCPSGADVGLFSDPHSLEEIKVSGAGCARFWIEFELGKFLFPAITNGNLEILDPTIVAEARRAFGIGFVQGCCW
jgi:hypothetical protein